MARKLNSTCDESPFEVFRASHWEWAAVFYLPRDLNPNSWNASWKVFILLICGIAILAPETFGQTVKPLELMRKIPLPDITGRIDHMALDSKRDRLLVAALASHRLEVVDLKSHEVVHSVFGLNEPQGVVYVPDFDRIFVADGGGGQVHAYTGKSYAEVGSIDFGDDADNLRYDASARRVYVGYGTGAIGSIDVTSMQRKGNVELRGHPESFQLEKAGTKLYVNVPTGREVVVIDRATMSVSMSWALNALSANFPMSLDEKNHRLFVGTRQPARVLVQDTISGKAIVELLIAGDTDDLFYDGARRQLYVSCGEGVLQVFREEEQNHFKELSRIPTAPGARTSLLDSEGGRLFLAVPRSSSTVAAIWVYRINPLK